jgi:hypothetical protein
MKRPYFVVIGWDEGRSLTFFQGPSVDLWPDILCSRVFHFNTGLHALLKKRMMGRSYQS